MAKARTLPPIVNASSKDNVADELKLNKSHEIREAINANPDLQNMEIANLLNAKYPGTTFTNMAVGAIRAKMKKKAEGGQKPSANGFRGGAASPFMAKLKELKDTLGERALAKIIEDL